MGIFSFLKKLFTETVPTGHSNVLGRNEPCHCGSKLKYKRCHLESDRQALAAQESRINASSMNASHEPEWSGHLTNAQNVAQQGLKNAPDFLKKKQD